MKNTLTAIASALFVLAAASAGTQAMAKQIGGMKANVGKQQITPVPCNSVSFCNHIIAYCAEQGGNWIETEHDGQGRPSKGTCYLD